MLLYVGKQDSKPRQSQGEGAGQGQEHRGGIRVTEVPNRRLNVTYSNHFLQPKVLSKYKQEVL